MIYDTFLFFNELDLLEIRLNVLSSVVDKFVLVEATRTFTGREKPLYFQENRKRFSAFSDRIIHVVVDDFPSFESAWINESHQRNAILRGLIDAKPDDRILLNDLDEIPRPELVREFAKKNGPFQFDMDYYAYYLNCLNVTDPHWKAAKLVSFDFLQHGLDGKRIVYSHVIPPSINEGTTPTIIRWSPSFRAKTIPHGGWHFSSLGGGEAVIAKMTSFSHSEFNTAEKHDPKRLEQAILSGKSPLYDIHFFAVPVDARFPEYLLGNQKKFERFFFRTDPAYFSKTRWRRRYYSFLGHLKYQIRRLLPFGLLELLHKIRARIQRP